MQMTTLAENLGKKTLRFSVEGLSPRDELLLKSLVRILDHRTEYSWQCISERIGEQVDLRVVSERSVVNIEPRLAANFQAVLIITSAQPAEVGVLALPLRADLLEQELNRQGRLICGKQDQLPDHAAPSIPSPALSIVQPGFEPVRILNTSPLRLNRWPPIALLNSSAKLKMATLLSGKPITVAQLADRANQTLSLCNDFIAELRRANLVVEDLVPVTAMRINLHSEESEENKSPEIMNATRGLLSRIRVRLGL